MTFDFILITKLKNKRRFMQRTEIICDASHKISQFCEKCRCFICDECGLKMHLQHEDQINALSSHYLTKFGEYNKLLAKLEDQRKTNLLN